MEQRNETIRYSAIVGAAAMAVALLMTFAVFRRQGMVSESDDPYGYGRIAHGFLEHGFDKLTRRAASLYPHFLAVIYWLGGGLTTIQLLQCTLHAGTCLLIFFLGVRLYNPRTGLIAGLACAVHPMLIRYIPDLHMETLLVFLCTLTVSCAVRFHYRPTVPNGVLLGAIGMITALTKGVILPYLVVFGAIEFVRGLRDRKGARTAASGVVAMAVTMTVLIAPWTYRNYKVTHGKFVLLTPGSSDSFLRGYIFTRSEFATLRKEPYTYAENESNRWFKQIARDAGTTWELDEVADEANNARVAKELVRTQPLDTLRKCVVGVFTFWYEMTNLKNSLVAGGTALAGWVLAFIGLRKAKREGRAWWLLPLYIVVMNVFVATLIPLGRYSAPVLPCLMILAAFGVDAILVDRRAISSDVPRAAS